MSLLLVSNRASGGVRLLTRKASALSAGRRQFASDTVEPVARAVRPALHRAARWRGRRHRAATLSVGVRAGTPADVRSPHPRVWVHPSVSCGPPAHETLRCIETLGWSLAVRSPGCPT